MINFDGTVRIKASQIYEIYIDGNLVMHNKNLEPKKTTETTKKQ